jgi:colicin import membrane protein
MSTRFERDPLLPRPPGGLGAGAGLALTAHAALIAALIGGLQWRTETPAVVAAELWAAVPQSAAPRPVQAPAPTPEPVASPPPPAPAPPPPPPPAAAPREAPAPPPDIALERERRAREAQAQAERERLQREQRQREQARQAQAERERAERERAERLQAQREQQAKERAERARAERERQAAEARVAQAREEQLRRLMASTGTGAPTATGTAAQDAAPSRSYAGRLVAHIKPNIVFTDQVPGNPAAEVEVRAGPSGSIISRRLVKSSGHREWDEAVLRAIDRTGSLPRDVDGRVPSVILVSFRPQE